MGRIRMAAVDLDGTMMNDAKEISPRSWAAVDCAVRHGAWFVPATGRTLAVMPKELKTHPHIHYAVCSNGAAVVHLKTGRVLYEAGLPKEKTLELIRGLAGRDIHLDVFADGRALTARRGGELAEGFPLDARMKELVRKSRIQVDSLEEYVRTEARCVERLNIFYKTEEDREELLALFRADGELAAASSIFHNLEVSSRRANKGESLRWLAGYLGIPMEEVMAVGDSDNDVTMLHSAGLGVAMGNALPEVKAAADVQTDSNEEDGMAKAVERWIGRSAQEGI